MAFQEHRRHIRWCRFWQFFGTCTICVWTCAILGTLAGVQGGDTLPGVSPPSAHKREGPAGYKSHRDAGDSGRDGVKEMPGQAGHDGTEPSGRVFPPCRPKEHAVTRIRAKCCYAITRRSWRNKKNGNSFCGMFRRLLCCGAGAEITTAAQLWLSSGDL